MENRDDILATLKEVLAELFEIDPNDVSLESQLYEDLDIDSIDAIDMVVKLREITGKKVDPEEFKAVRNVSDVVEAVAKMIGQ